MLISSLKPAKYLTVSASRPIHIHKVSWLIIKEGVAESGRGLM